MITSRRWSPEPAAARAAVAIVVDATVERRLTHAPDPILARHVANLSLISGTSGLRPDLDLAQGQPIAAALGEMIAFDGVTRLEPCVAPFVGTPSEVW
jgi:hypothetical protein